MIEVYFQKRKTKKVVMIHIYTFWKARDHPREEETEKVARLIEIGLKKHGYERKDDWVKEVI